MYKGLNMYLRVALGEGEKKGQEGRLELYACDGYSRKRPQDTGTRSIKEALIHVGPSGT
jgi:hypothetical protein